MHGSFSQKEFVSILSCWMMIWLGAKATLLGNSQDALVWLGLKDPLQDFEECELQFQWYQKQLILFFRSADIKEAWGFLISGFNWGLVVIHFHPWVSGKHTQQVISHHLKNCWCSQKTNQGTFPVANYQLQMKTLPHACWESNLPFHQHTHVNISNCWIAAR